MAADPKPIKRMKATTVEWNILRRLKLGYQCRVCGSRATLELHHLVGRDLGGDDVPENLVPLCWTCHPLVEERKPVACHVLRANLLDDELAYIRAKKGDGFLKRYYPLAVAA